MQVPLLHDRDLHASTRPLYPRQIFHIQPCAVNVAVKAVRHIFGPLSYSPVLIHCGAYVVQLVRYNGQDL